MTMTDDLLERLQIGWHDEDTPPWVSNAMSEAKTRIEALTADFALQVQRTDEQREAYEQALSVMEADNARLLEIVRDALDAWDTHHKYGDPMQGHWASDARAALTGKEPMREERFAQCDIFEEEPSHE
jgi:hypothetical protein